jgi:hypothetical protein
MVAIIITVTILSTGFCWRTAKRKRLNVQFWIIMGACFGPLAIPFVLLARSRALTA